MSSGKEDKCLPGHSPTQCEGRCVKEARGSQTNPWLSVPRCQDGLTGPQLGHGPPWSTLPLALTPGDSARQGGIATATFGTTTFSPLHEAEIRQEMDPSPAKPSRPEIVGSSFTASGRSSRSCDRMKNRAAGRFKVYSALAL